MSDEPTEPNEESHDADEYDDGLGMPVDVPDTDAELAHQQEVLEEGMGEDAEQENKTEVDFDTPDFSGAG
jgi:hypothetical protein